MTVLLLALSALCILVGLIGCVVPGVAGPPFSFLGLILLSFSRDWQPFSPGFLVIMAVITVIVTVLDFIVPAVGARRFGASRAGFWGAVAGMILGNSLRADIVGLSTFFSSLRTEEKSYLLALSQGATLSEAVRPFLQKAYTASLAPTIATMATIGIVALPGMMTGIILGGTDPFVAIKYQIAIMMAIFSGTALAVILGILLTLKTSFDRYGVLDPDILK